ncbi:50S ribosome-binding protein YggL [Chromobacterium sp. CV08]|uniref:50S ribosome-binding protein YggL n=1 Tax=Chromobacterium sp. CV08 TaxID=3133274 RepID=UPI003DA850C5
MAFLRNPNSAQRLKRLNARQRKKMRVGEFRELGFHLVAELRDGADADALLDGWLTRFDEAGISFGGHFDGKNRLEGVAFPVSGNQITEALRGELVAWLQAREEVQSLEASELIDLWHAA